MKHEHEVRNNYMKTINNACRELMKATGIDLDKVDPDNVVKLKDEINAKGFKMNMADLPSHSLATVVIMHFKGEFIAGYHIRLDPILSVIKMDLIENESDLKKVIYR